MLSGLLIVSFLSYSDFTYWNRAQVMEIKIHSINNFLQDLKDDIGRGIYTSGFRSIFSLTGFSVANGTYIKNLDLAFQEVFMNGTYNQTNLTLMENSSFRLWIQRAETLGYSLGLIINISVDSITLSQSTPWFVDIEVNTTIDIKDIQDLATWHVSETTIAQVPIQGFEDPIYSLNTNKRAVNTFEISNLSVYVGSGGNIGNLSYLVNTSRYTSWNQAPNFLMRLQGNLSADPNGQGIESLVNLLQLSNLDIEVENKSVVDYIYFSSSDPLKYKVEGMPEWFKLDNLSNGTHTHHEKYQVEGILD